MVWLWQQMALQWWRWAQYNHVGFTFLSLLARCLSSLSLSANLCSHQQIINRYSSLSIYLKHFQFLSFNTCLLCFSQFYLPFSLVHYFVGSWELGLSFALLHVSVNSADNLTQWQGFLGCFISLYVFFLSVQSSRIKLQSLGNILEFYSYFFNSLAFILFIDCIISREFLYMFSLFVSHEFGCIVFSKGSIFGQCSCNNSDFV